MYKRIKMTTKRFVLVNSKSTAFFICAFSLTAMFGIQSVNPFLIYSLKGYPPGSIAQTRHAVVRDKTLNDVDKNIIAVTDSNYRELFSGERFLLLDAFAQWCGPCKLIEPVLEQCAEDWKDSVVVGKFDVDDSTSISRDLKVELILQGVMPQSLPALILVHDNKVLDTWKGVINPTQLQGMLENHVGKKHDLKQKHNVERVYPAKEGIHCENNVCKVPFKNGLSRPVFRGIGLVNDF